MKLTTKQLCDKLNLPQTAVVGLLAFLREIEAVTSEEAPRPPGTKSKASMMYEADDTTMTKIQAFIQLMMPDGMTAGIVDLASEANNTPPDDHLLTRGA